MEASHTVNCLFLNPHYLLHKHTHTHEWDLHSRIHQSDPLSHTHRNKFCSLLLFPTCTADSSRGRRRGCSVWVGVGGIWVDEGGGGRRETAAVYSYHRNLCLTAEFIKDEQCYKFSFMTSIFSLSVKHAARDLYLSYLQFLRMNVFILWMIIRQATNYNMADMTPPCIRTTPSLSCKVWCKFTSQCELWNRYFS